MAQTQLVQLIPFRCVSCGTVLVWLFVLLNAERPKQVSSIPLEEEWQAEV